MKWRVRIGKRVRVRGRETGQMKVWMDEGPGVLREGTNKHVSEGLAELKDRANESVDERGGAVREQAYGGVVGRKRVRRAEVLSSFEAILM